MSSLYACSHCGTWNRIPDGTGNKRIQCGQCHQDVFPTQPLHASDDNFEQLVMQAPRPVLVDFWAPWCGPCQMLGPVLEQLASAYAGRLIIVKVDIDQNPALASRFSVRSVPTMMLFKQGQVVDTIMGAMPAAALQQKIEPHLGDAA